MSLISWRLVPQCVSLVTDTNHYLACGAVVGHGTKFIHAAHARLLVADIGPADAGQELYRIASETASIDQFSEHAPAALAAIHEEILERYAAEIEETETQ